MAVATAASQLRQSLLGLPLLHQPRTAIMGVINTTPDSFSDGGQFENADMAIEHGLRLIEEGADILDIGGESTRPGAKAVALEQELERVIPVIEGLRRESNIAISIDTSKPQLMTEAVKAGASMINDVKALQVEGALPSAAKAGVSVCLMHMLGDPKTMQNQPRYDSVVDQVLAFLKERIEACEAHGIKREMISIDPGIGFGKTLQHNLLLLKNIGHLRAELGCPVLIGVSRKSLIDSLLGRPVDERLHGSVGLAVQAVLNGAQLVRVHDVRATHDAIRCAEAVAQA